MPAAALPDRRSQWQRHRLGRRTRQNFARPVDGLEFQPSAADGAETAIAGNQHPRIGVARRRSLGFDHPDQHKTVLGGAGGKIPR
jgi:hypothetical protein